MSDGFVLIVFGARREPRLERSDRSPAGSRDDRRLATLTRLGARSESGCGRTVGSANPAESTKRGVIISVETSTVPWDGVSVPSMGNIAKPHYLTNESLALDKRRSTS